MRWTICVATIAGAVVMMWIAYRSKSNEENENSNNFITAAEGSAGALSALVALLTFLDPFAWFEAAEQSTASPGVQGDVGDENVLIFNSGDVGDVTIEQGDSSTSAQARYDSAFAAIEDEYVREIQNRLSEVLIVESLPIEPFWDSPRPDESEQEFEERSRRFFADSIAEIDAALLSYPVVDTVFRSKLDDLGHVGGTSSRFTTAYGHLAESHAALQGEIGLLGGLRSLATRDMPAAERVQAAQSPTAEKLLRARVQLAQSGAEYALVDEQQLWPRFQEAMLPLGVDLDEPGESSYHALLRMAGALQQEIALVISER